MRFSIEKEHHTRTLMQFHVTLVCENRAAPPVTRDTSLEGVQQLKKDDSDDEEPAPIDSAYSSDNSTHQVCGISEQKADISDRRFDEEIQRYRDGLETGKWLCAAIQQTDAEVQRTDVFSWTTADLKTGQQEDSEI